MDTPSDSKGSVSSEALGTLLDRLGIGRATTNEGEINLIASSSSSDSEDGEFADSAALERSQPQRALYREGSLPTEPSVGSLSGVEIIDLVASSDSDSSRDSDSDDGNVIIMTTVQKPRKNVIDSDSDSDVGSSGSGDSDFGFAQPPIQPPRPSQPSLAFLSQRDRANFTRNREALAKTLYTKYNSIIFGKRLPADLDISWNKRLATTAGLTHYKREVPADLLLPPRYTARIELSCKVLDDESKLERTLIHEMCHVAAWLIDHTAKPPHGAAFKAWAQRAMRAVPGIDVSTCHQYQVRVFFKLLCGCRG